MPVPLLNAIASNLVKVVDDPETVLIHMPFESVFLTVSPLMFRVGDAMADEPTLNV